MTTEELEAIRARAEAATPGPWTHGGYPLKGIGGPEVLAAGDVHLLTMVCRPDDDTDATFIAHARQDVPALCDEVARLTSECHAMDEAITIACADRDAYAADLREAEAEIARLRATVARLDDSHRRICARLGHDIGSDDPHVAAEGAVAGLAMEADSLRAELAESLATIANERGEGEPPVEGWFRNDFDRGVISWTLYLDADMNPVDTPDGIVERWVLWAILTRATGKIEWNVDECEEGITVMRGESSSLRSAMRAAYAALKAVS